MILVRSWRRQLVGAQAAALIVPGAMLAAVIVLALAGSFAWPGSLGQAFSGPSVPSGKLAASPRAAGEHPTGTASIAAGQAATSAALTTAAAAATSLSATSGPRASSGGSAEPGAASGQRVAGGPGDRGGAGAAPGTGRHGSAPQKPAPSPTVTDRALSAATSVTRQLPPPVGPVSTGTLQSVGSTLDHAAPLPAPEGTRALHLRAAPAS
jgi:hypothetical protein